jgi:hypothetical protein
LPLSDYNRVNVCLDDELEMASQKLTLTGDEARKGAYHARRDKMLSMVAN